MLPVHKHLWHSSLYLKWMPPSVSTELWAISKSDWITKKVWEDKSATCSSPATFHVVFLVIMCTAKESSDKAPKLSIFIPTVTYLNNSGEAWFFQEVVNLLTRKWWQNFKFLPVYWWKQAWADKLSLKASWCSFYLLWILAYSPSFFLPSKYSCYSCFPSVLYFYCFWLLSHSPFLFWPPDYLLGRQVLHLTKGVQSYFCK